MQTEMPLHPTIVEYLERNPAFKDCLKIYNLDDFARLGIVIITGIEEYPADEVIGTFTLQRSESLRQQRTFIQDYVVWHKDSDTLTYYTGVPADMKSVTEVLHIRHFWKKYGMGRYYGTEINPSRGNHWYRDVDDLPDVVRAEGARVLRELSKP